MRGHGDYCRADWGRQYRPAAGVKISATELKPRAHTTAAAIIVAGANVTAPWASETMTLMLISPKHAAESGRTQS